MSGIFRFDSKPMRFLSFTGDLIILNILFLVCSFPVITVGASASAMYTMTIRMRRDEVSGGTIKGFYRAFAQNFKKGTLLWLLYAVVGALLICDYFLFNAVTIPGGAVIKAIFVTVAILYAVSLSWVFALQARFENRVMQTVKNSLILAFTNPGTTIPAVILTASPWIMLYYNTDWFIKVLPLWGLLAFSLIAYLNSMLFEKVFYRYEVETSPVKEDKTEQ